MRLWKRTFGSSRIAAHGGCGAIARQAFVDSTLAGALLCLTAAVTVAQDQNLPVDVIAAQIRHQGFECRDPVSTRRLDAQSRPDEPLYLITCAGESYRVRLIPHREAEISKAQNPQSQSD